MENCPYEDYEDTNNYVRAEGQIADGAGAGNKNKDTIFALSTPTGKSAVALIRISGKQSLSILKKISSLKKIAPNKTKLTFLKFQKQIIMLKLIPVDTFLKIARVKLKWKSSFAVVFQYNLQSS